VGYEHPVFAALRCGKRAFAVAKAMATSRTANIEF